jgi:hypothetical protein
MKKTILFGSGRAFLSKRTSSGGRKAEHPHDWQAACSAIAA